MQIFELSMNPLCSCGAEDHFARADLRRIKRAVMCAAAPCC